MFGKDTILYNIINGIKNHSKSFGVAGSVTGAILVIYYCGSINFYPSGLTISDTLFFLWSIIVFGFYYSIVAFAFFVASLFWLFLFSRPINFILKRINSTYQINNLSPKTDKFFILFGGLISNVAIIGISISSGHSLLSIIGALFLIGFLYTLIDNVSKNNKPSGNGIFDAKEKLINEPSISIGTLKFIFYAMVYSTPLLVAQVGGGVTRTTFETMGVIQPRVNIILEKKGYQIALQNYQTSGYLQNIEYKDSIIVSNADILFTGIGTNTKIQLKGEKGSIDLVIPSKYIQLIAKTKPNKIIKRTKTTGQ